MTEIQTYIVEHPTAVVVTLTLLVVILLLVIGNGFKHVGIGIDLREQLAQQQSSQQELEHAWEIERVQNEDAVVSARREFMGYKQAVSTLTAHPTTVIVSPPAFDLPTAGQWGATFDEHGKTRDVRAAARNGEPI